MGWGGRAGSTYPRIRAAGRASRRSLGTAKTTLILRAGGGGVDWGGAEGRGSRGSVAGRRSGRLELGCPGANSSRPRAAYARFSAAAVTRQRALVRVRGLWPLSRCPEETCSQPRRRGSCLPVLVGTDGMSRTRGRGSIERVSSDAQLSLSSVEEEASLVDEMPLPRTSLLRSRSSSDSTSAFSN